MAGSQGNNNNSFRITELKPEEEEYVNVSFVNQSQSFSHSQELGCSAECSQDDIGVDE